MPNLAWAEDWTAGVRIWIDRRGETVLGEGRAELLQAIDQRRSITAAAKSLGMSYRRAWNLVQAVNQAAGQPLVESAVGGLQGGGARLTDRGRVAVDHYWRLHRSATTAAAAALKELAAATGSEARPAVHVAAAISMQEALGQIVAAFALRRPAIPVRVIYGASNELVDHLLAGAPANLFVSAQSAEIERLAAAGRLTPKSRRVVALNALAIIGPRGAKPIPSLDRLVQSDSRIALASPDCPLGRYTKNWLEHAGIYEKLRLRILQLDNSRAILSAIASGAAAVGVAFASDAANSAEIETLLRVPRKQTEAEYVAALVSDQPAQDDAQLLLDFLSEPAAIRCLRRCGFKAPAAAKQLPVRRKPKATS